MALIQTKFESDYPDSDGEPMGETDWHIEWTIRLRDLLKWRYRDQQVYIGSDLIIYYQEGEPLKSVVPDGFVVLNHSPQKRRIYKVWDEGNRGPDVVFEFTSLSSKQKDTVQKPSIYAGLGVKEYFVYDPEREYLQPPLQGFRLRGSSYVRIEPDSTNAYHCQTLGLSLKIVDDDLAFFDTVTGKQLLTEAESEAQRAHDATQNAFEATERARKEFELRQQSEAELAKLRAELKKLRGED